jgi:hypothetical protein
MLSLRIGRALVVALAWLWPVSRAAAEPMTFEWLAPCEGIGRLCVQRVLARGDIEEDSGRKLERFVSSALTRGSRHASWRRVEVCFDSAGGDLEGALQLGDVIQRLRMDTCVEPAYVDAVRVQLNHSARMPSSSIPAMCASACVFALAAGVHRTITEGARIGVHQFSGQHGELGQELTQIAIAELAQYLEQNGVQRKLVDIGAGVPRQLVRFLTAEEISTTNLDNQAQVYDAWKLNA